jgi:hypothetical protein
VLGHIGDPEFIGLVAVKLARDPIFCRRDTSHVTKLWSSRDALNLGPTHQELDSLVTNIDASAERELGMNATDSVDASRERMHLPDHIGEPLVTDGAQRGCA